MGIKPNFSPADLSKMMQARKERIVKAIIMTLSYLGEMCVNQARDSGDYNDRSGNLRSSIGYIILVNGNTVHQNFVRAGAGKMEVSYSNLKTKKVTTKTIDSGDDGVTIARNYAFNLAAQFRNGYALIVVAGMNYASYVEATGRNVLSSAEHLAQERLPIMLRELKRKAA